MKRKLSSAFSLLEVLIVVVIIGLILTISAFGLQNARDVGRDTKRQADIQKIRSGLTRFYSDCGRYPINSVFNAVTTGGTLTGDSTIAPGCLSTNKYIVDFPRDPEPGVSYYYNRVDNANYIICASLQTPPNPAQNVTGCGSCGSRACNIKFTN